MAGLLLSLLGPFQVTRDGQPLTAFATDAVRALLAYLATEAGPPHRREALAGLLWPEEPDARAMQSLRQTLSRLRQALAEGERVGTYAAPYLLTSHESVQLNPTAHWQVDVAAFAAALAATRVHRHRRPESCLSCMARLREAVTLYRGEFMAGFSLPSAPFEEWLLARRESLRLHALHALAAHHERRGEHEAALGYARRQLELEGWREEAHRQAMCALARSGQRAAALAQYEACRQVLRKELDVEPEEETTALYERIRAGEETRSLPEAGFLPAPLTPFIGRERELAQIEDWLADPSCRLLTLVGPGGCGKTHLALEAARAQSYAFQHGVFWVSLASVPSPEGIVPAVAQALGLTFYPGEEPHRQLLAYLRPREVLLVLDNCEHLCGEHLPAGPEGEPGDGAGLLVQLLDAAPRLCILATSRSRLELLGERLLLVPGMEAPAPDLPDGGHKMVPLSPHRSVLDYSAVQLYLHTVRRAHPGYEPTAQELGHVAHLCRLVEGMPLAILLAAAWADTLSLAEIADHVARDLGFLEAEWHDLPPRQRSMRAVCDASWRLLSEREQRVFAALAVFRGGFTTKAAQAVAGADARTLRSLVHKSFLQVEPGGRYTVHELLRQFGEERLARTADGGQETRDRHAACYAAAAVRWEAGLKGIRGSEVLAEMVVEIHNAETAWGWLSERADVAQLGEMIHAMGEFYAMRGLYRQGEAAFAQAAARLLAAGGAAALSSPALLHVRGRLLTWQGRCAFASGRREQTAELLRQAQAALDQAERSGEDVRAARAWALHSAWEAAADVDRTAFRGLAEQSLALYRELDDPWGIVQALSDLGISSFFDGIYPLARRMFEERLALAQRQGIGDGIADSVTWLSFIAAAQGELDRAEHMARELAAPLLASYDRMAQAGGSFILGTVLDQCGQYAAAEPLLEEGVALLRELGAHVLVYRLLTNLVSTKLHLGQYKRAGELGREFLERARQMEAWMFVGLALKMLAQAATVVEDYESGARTLEESIALLRRAGTRAFLGSALGCMAFVARGLGPALSRSTEQAWEWVSQALQLGVECKAVHPLLLALPAAALLLAGHGQSERAIELYALAWRHPVVANSRWFEDVAGRELAVVAASLPPEVREAAQARGRARDLWATAHELAAESAIRTTERKDPNH
jgi:predicted ATPase/DNA-binding SARP family transcriptional activator